MARALGLDAEALAPPTDPPAPAGDLRAEIDGFTTLDACVTEHARTDPLVGDALRAIGYDTFLRDACRVLAAMKDKKVDVCKSIDAQGLRLRCEASVAMSVGAPDSCPWEVFDTPSRGRDARCVAVASRDARLCAGSARADRVACEAMVARDEKRCAGDAACAREVSRWRNVLPPPESAGAPFTTRAKLTLHGADGTADPAQTETDLASDFSRGIVVMMDFEGSHVEIGMRQQIGTTMFAPPPTTRARLALALLVPEDKLASIEHAEVAVPGGATLVLPGVRFDGSVRVTKLEPVRGGDLEARLDGTLGAPPRAYKVKVEIATFVRDVVRAPTAAVAPKKR